LRLSNAPDDAKVDSAGNIFITDYSNNVVRVVYAGGTVPPILAAESVTPHKGYIYTVAGQVDNSCSAPDTCGDGGSAVEATFGAANYTVVDSSGNLYITDYSANTVRFVYAGGSTPAFLSGANGTVTSAPTTGDIYTVAGTQFSSCSSTTTPPVNCGDGGLALGALLNTPNWITVDGSGNIYIADTGDNTIRKLDYSGYISDIAGTESPGVMTPIGIETGPATSVMFNGPVEFAFDQSNNLYPVDTGNGLIWKAVPLLPQAITFTVLASVVYGAGPVALTASSSSSLPINYSLSGPATLSSSGNALLVNGAGTVTVTASQSGNSQYAPALSVVQQLTVSPAPITVTAQSASCLAGSASPTFVASIAGFVPPDDAQTALAGAPAFSTDGVTCAQSAKGVYPLDITIGSLALTSQRYQTNYTLSNFVDSTLSITNAANHQTITFSAIPSISYGSERTLQLTAVASSGLPVTYTYTGFAIGISGAGNTIIHHKPGSADRDCAQLLLAGRRIH
jgi:hypothetical protein